MINKNDKEWLASLVAGGLIGAGLVLLFAPQSGDKTVKSIKRISKDVKDRVNLTHFVKEI